MSRAKATKRKADTRKPTSDIKKKPINPFDLKYMKKKNASEPEKVVQGKPLVARKRAMEIRQQTLGVEYQRFGKVNQIEDRRIGEKQKLSNEEKAEKRFMAQRQMLTSKRSRFNLGDDEDSLTHLGQSLSSVARYEKTVDSDDEGGLNEDVVALANFGGGSMTVKLRDEEGIERKLSRKEIISEVIAKSKHAKAIKKMARDEYDEATDKLDEQLKSLMSSGMLTRQPKIDSKSTNNDNYDTFFREIQLNADQRAAASQPTKTDEEIAEERQKAIQMLEEDKARRMAPEDSAYIPHESADMDVESVEVSSRQKRRDEKRGKDDFELRYDQSGRIILDEKNKATLVGEEDEVTGEPTNPKKRFLHKLQEFDDIAKESTRENIEKIGRLLPELFTMAKIDADFSSRCMRALLRQKWKIHKKTKHDEPDFSIIAYLRLVADIYPTSDRWHPVTIPSLYFALEVVSSTRFKRCFGVVRVLFICGILAKWVEESKRYLPEVMATLQGILMLAVKSDESEIFPTMNFPITEPYRSMLHIDQKIKSHHVEPLSLSQVFSSDNQPDGAPELRSQVLRILFSTIQKFIHIYAEHREAFCAVFGRFLSLWKRLPVENYPEVLKNEAKTVQSLLEKHIEENSPVTQLKRKTKQNIKILKMLEPEFEEDFDPERPRLRKDPQRKGPKAETRKLTRILKREKRGAMKELRLDAKYLANVQDEERRKISRERIEKTNKILQSLQSQESEHKKKKLKKF